MRLDKLLSNLGYCSRKDVRGLLRDGFVNVEGVDRLKPDTDVSHDKVQFDGKPLDPPFGLCLMLNKPCGYSCSRADSEESVYGLLPVRYGQRTPALSTVGRLDKDTSGLLLLTDDGDLLHRITSPKKHVEKTYLAKLAEPLKGNEIGIFASGTLMLEDETDPLKPAKLRIIEPTLAEVKISEGRYHQVRRMFAAVGNAVVTLHRSMVGNLTLGELPEGEFKILGPDELALVFEGKEDA